MKLVYPNNITGVSADSEATGFAADNVLTDYIGEKWKATSTHATLTCTVSAGDTIAIFGVNARTVQVRQRGRISLSWSTTDETYGSELLTNGDFTNWTGTAPNDTPDGWTTTGEDGANNYITESSAGGQCHIYGNGNNLGIHSVPTFTIGKLYKFEFDIVDASVGNFYFHIDGSGTLYNYGPYNTVGHYTFYLAGNDGHLATWSGSAPVDMIIDNLTIKEVTGRVLTWATGDAKTLSWASYSDAVIPADIETFITGSKFLWVEYDAIDNQHFIELEFDNYGGDNIEVGAVFIGKRLTFKGAHKIQENLIDYSIVFESDSKGVVYIDKDADDVVREFTGQIRASRSDSSDDDYYDLRNLVIQSGRKPMAAKVAESESTESVVLARLNADLIRTSHDYTKKSIIQFALREVR